jgi:hypothetical protein
MSQIKNKTANGGILSDANQVLNDIPIVVTKKGVIMIKKKYK